MAEVEYQDSEALSDLEKLEEIIRTLDTAIELRKTLYDDKGVIHLQAKKDLYSAFEQRAHDISETIGSAAVAQEVVRGNIPMIAQALRLAEVEGLI